MSKNLRTFMRDAVARFPGSIKTIDVPVERRFGITAYAAKLAQNGEYKGLLFNNVIGSRFPVVTNLMSSYDRMAMAMNCQIEELPQVYGTRVNKPIAPVTATAAPTASAAPATSWVRRRRRSKPRLAAVSSPRLSASSAGAGLPASVTPPGR